MMNARLTLSSIRIEVARVESSWCAPFRPIPLKGYCICSRLGLKWPGQRDMANAEKGGWKEEAKIEGRGTDPFKMHALDLIQVQIFQIILKK
jgi:hypothetical protein